MKTPFENLIAVALAVALASGLATSVSAAPPGKGGTLKTGTCKQVL